MSALAAVFLRDGRAVAPEQLAALSEALRPFGTANVVERSDGCAGLVRRDCSAFTPEATSDHQPAGIGDGGLLLFAGFLHHRPELAAMLGIGPPRAAGMADGTLFAHAWERWDKDAALHVEGEFAALIWNRKHRRLTAVCSPLRSPPLCFSVNRRRAIVATAPCGVFAWGDLQRRLDDERLASNLIFDHADPRTTLYKDVRSLCPGEMLTVTPETVAVHRYYDLASRVEPVRLATESDYVEAAGEHLRGAVRNASRAPETPAIMMSGGLDSTTVAITALETIAGDAAADRLISFTACPAPGWDGRVGRRRIGDERPLVRKLAAMYPALDTRFVDAGRLDFDHLLDRTIALAELPPAAVANLPWLHECGRQARAAGKRVILTGISGNATLSYLGLPRLAALLRAGSWVALLREAAMSRRGRIGRLNLLRHALLPFLPYRLRHAIHRWTAPSVSGPLGFSAVHPDFARDTRVHERAREHGSGWHSPPPRSCPDGQIRILTSPFIQGDARAQHLAMQVIHGVVDRDPLGERRLVEWCLGIPDKLYFHGGRTRRLIRLLMRDRLPEEILSGPPARQAADRHLHLSRALPRIREMLNGWRGDPAVAGRIDLDRLLRVVDTWPASAPLSPRDHPDHLIVTSGLDRAISAGRFIRWVERGYQSA